MTDYLFLIAELAAAFAGFTAIVSVLNTRADASKRALDVLRLRAMLEASLCTIALALLPTLLLEVGIGAAAWRWANGTATVVVGVVYVAQMRRGFTPEMKSIPGYSRAFASFLTGLGLVGLGCVLAGAFGVGSPPALYLVALTMLLAVAGSQFFRASVSIMEGASS